MNHQIAGRVALAAVAFCVAGSAGAEPLRWQIAGIYQEVDGAPPGPLAALGVGDTFTLNLYFDSDDVQTVGNDRDTGSYGVLMSPSEDFSFKTNFFGGASHTIQGIGNPAMFFDILDNEPGDGVQASINPIGVRGKTPVVGIEFGLMGAESLWDGTDLRTSFQLADFLGGSLTMTYPNGSATATLVSWQTTVIPGPGAAALLALGVIAMKNPRQRRGR